jgi:hypothetical protein
MHGPQDHWQRRLIFLAFALQCWKRPKSSKKHLVLRLRIIVSAIVPSIVNVTLFEPDAKVIATQARFHNGRNFGLLEKYRNQQLVGNGSIGTGTSRRRRGTVPPHHGTKDKRHVHTKEHRFDYESFCLLVYR